MRDLISREALREAFKAWKTTDDYYHNTDCNDIPFSEAFDLIDNAPIVEYTFEESFQKTVCEQRLYCPARPQVNCENCDFRKFTETFVDGVVDVMNKNGITSVEQLQEILKGGKE